MGWFAFKPYVPVAQRRAQAAREVAKRTKSGEAVEHITIEGRTIASTFWGKAWCENLEAYSDFENRLPRGRTYVRNGSVVHLKIAKGRIDALVSGSSLYTVRIDIDALPSNKWQALKRACSGQIGSLVELLQGKLSTAVMERVTDRKEGLFPKPAEIRMSCSCPDYAGMCKHVAAVMYGVGHRLDSSPEGLFVLRGVDKQELIESAIPTAPKSKGSAPSLSGDLGAIFGIDLDDTPAAEPAKPKRKPRVAKLPTKVTKPSVASSKKTTKSKRAPKKG